MGTKVACHPAPGRCMRLERTQPTKASAMTVFAESLLLHPRLWEAQGPCPQGSGCRKETGKGTVWSGSNHQCPLQRRHRELLRIRRKGRCLPPGTKTMDADRRRTARI